MNDVLIFIRYYYIKFFFDIVPFLKFLKTKSKFIKFETNVLREKNYWHN